MVFERLIFDIRIYIDFYMRHLLFGVLFFCFINGYSQSALKLIERGENLSKRLSYPEAIESFERALNQQNNLSKEDILKARIKLGEAYFMVKDYLNAERVYADALRLVPILKGDDLNAYKRYAQVLSSLGRYSDSKYFWEKYTELNQKDQRGIQYSKLYAQLTPLLRNQASYVVDYLGINSGFPDFSPSYYREGIVFVSGRDQQGAIKRIFKWNNTPFLDLYFLDDTSKLSKTANSAAVLGSGIASGSNTRQENMEILGKDYYTAATANDTKTIANKDQSSTFVKPTIPTKKFSRKLNSKYHEGPSAFYNYEKNIIFTRNSPPETGILNLLKKNDNQTLKLYTAKKSKNDWADVEELPFNSNEYSCGHPTITQNGKLLFFVSDMPGGFGGTDIYFSVFENSKWSEPRNAGAKINTVGDEMFPFLDASGKLYFSSDGLPGLGSLDIFVTTIDLNTREVIAPTRNLGAPLNSQYDDFGIITDEDRTSGFFSSNRKNGDSDDDIYSFKRVGALFGCRDLVLSVKDANNLEVFDNLKFSYWNTKRESTVENVITNNQGMIRLCLEADQEFKVAFEKDGYEKTTLDYSNFNSSDFEPDTLKVYLVPVKIEPEKPKVTPKPKSDRLVQKWTSDESITFRAIITSANGEPVGGAIVRFINGCTGEVQEQITKSNGAVEFKRDLKCDYELVSTKEGYTLSSDYIEKSVKKNFFGKKIKKPASANLFNSKIYKVGDLIQLQNIYYSSSGYKLNARAKQELSKLADVMKKNPYMAIEIISHTDTRGNDIVNKQLSERRAAEAANYLKRYIDKSRIRAIGKGETEPVNNCGDGVQCTENEHARNRRTEIKILRMKKL